MNVLLILMLTLLVSCANPFKKAVNNAKYSAYEAIGVEKRDLFKREVKNVKAEQEDTSEAFKDALTQLKELYKFDGGDLEKQHDRLKNSYESAKEKANEVHARITKVDQVANDLFDEWKGEISEIKTSEFRSKSSKQLSETKAKYKELSYHLKKSEAKMDPLLSKLNDQVLFLKHNLNAKAIAGLKTESSEIQREVESLLEQMNKSSHEADEFIKTL